MANPHENNMRTHLVAQLSCTDCKGILRLSYKSKDESERGHDYLDDGITGAAKVQHRIYVEPCRKCVGDARKPLEAMREALASLGEH